MAATVFDEESLRFSFISKERLFIAKIRDYQRLVSTLHRDPRVVELVKTMVPWQKLSCSVTEKTLALKSEPSSSSSSTLDARDLFLVELLDWYKNQFFSWFDQPVCKNAICPLNGVQMESVGSGQPSLEDMSWGAARIELYKCGKLKLCFLFVVVRPNVHIMIFSIMWKFGALSTVQSPIKTHRN